MITIDPMLFADVADVLRISNPVLVEKDYYAVLLLKELSALRFDDYQLIFAGGTCLTKVHQNTHRMSEDIDIKLVASDEALGKSHSLQRQNRKVIHQCIVAMLESSPLFQLVETKKRNEGKFQQFLIQYPRYHDLVDALRPHIQLDITESALLEPSIKKSICSLYADEYGTPPTAELIHIGPDKYGLLLKHTYHGDGVEHSISIAAPYHHQISLAFHDTTSQNNFDNCGDLLSCTALSLIKQACC